MWLFVVGGILLFIVLLACLPLGVRLIYEDSLCLYAYVWKLRIRLLPRRAKTERAKDHTARARRRKARKEARKEKRKARRASVDKKEQLRKKHVVKRRTFAQVATFVREIGTTVLQLLLKFSGYAKVKIARLILIIGEGDAAETAKLYGAAQVAVSNVLGVLDEFVSVKKAEKEIKLHADFLAESSTIQCDICLQLRVWQAVVLAGKALFGFMRLKTVERQKKKIEKNP